MNKDVLTSLYILNFHRDLLVEQQLDLFGCQGSFGSFGIDDGDMEFTTTNIHIIRIGEHRPPCFARVSERMV